MIDSIANGHHFDPADVDALGDGWDAWVSGERHANLARADLDTIRALEQMARIPSPRAAFAWNLKQELAVRYDDTVLPLNPIRSRNRTAFPTSAEHQSRSATLRAGRRLWRVAATVALLLVTLTGVAFTLSQSRSDPTASTTALRSTLLTPENDDRWTCERPDPFIPCQEPVQHLAGVVLPVTPPYVEVLSAGHIQVQDWRVAPDGTVSVPLADAPGVVVDFVLRGTYAGVFDGEVAVYRSGLRTNGAWQSVDVGTIVELEPGDAVAFAPGALRSLRNPLTATELRFKRAVVSDDAQAFISASGARPTPGDSAQNGAATKTGWTVAVDEDATLADPLSTVSRTELVFELAYVSIPEGATFPPERAEPYVAIGPFAPEPNETGMTHGYVLFIMAPKG